MRLPSLVTMRSRPPLMKVVDLFPDPIIVTVGGNVVEAPAKTFPTDLTPGTTSFTPATITPYAEISSVIFSPLEQSDFVAAFFLGIAIMFGPDFILAPAGIVSDKGIRPGYSLESVLGSLLTPNDQWLKDRQENLAADSPLVIKASLVPIFFAAGLITNRLLLVALESSSFVISLAICSVIGCGFLEVIRQPLPTREERDQTVVLTDEFLIFSSQKIVVGGRCHERDIVKAFRDYYPRYRQRDMSRTSDGVSLSDDRIGDLVRGWNREMGLPGERTSSGYWKGISVGDVPRK